METFLLKLAVAVIPLGALVLLLPFVMLPPVRQTRHPLSWHRKRRNIQRALAYGIMPR